MTEVEHVDRNFAKNTVRLSGFRTLAVILSLSLALLVACASYGSLRFGSVAATLEFLRGQSILVDQRAKTINGMLAGSRVVVGFTLTNNSDRAVKLIGSTTSCACTVFEDLPITLASSETRTVSARITIPESNPNFSGTVRLFTDEPRSPEIALKYTVSAAHSLEARARTGL